MPRLIAGLVVLLVLAIAALAERVFERLERVPPPRRRRASREPRE